MGRYQADSANSFESSGGDSFRLAKDGDKAKVVFLYAGPESIDGWACHRFQMGSKGYTATVDCPRNPKDPLDMCPACKDGHQLYTRILVRMLVLNDNSVTVWDRASSFRKDLVGMMEYFNPLYSKVYEITRRGSGLQTTYTYQSLNDSGLTPEQYQQYVEQADAKAAEYVHPIDQYQVILGRWNAAKEADAQEGVTVDTAQTPPWAQPPQSQWGTPPQGQWGQAPAAPQPTPPQAPVPQNGGWGQQPVPQQGPATPQTPPVQQTVTAAQPQQGWGQAPQQWGQPPQQGWGQNS